MRILFIKQGFDPEPGFKGVKFVNTLKQYGVYAQVITGFPHRPGGKIYDGYSLAFSKIDKKSDLRFKRVYIFPSHDRSSFKRLITYISFAISSLLHGLYDSRTTQLVYAYTSPMTVGFSAYLISKVRKIPLVLDVQDLWPESLYTSGMVKENILSRVFGRLCDRIYKSADGIIVQSPGFKRNLISRGVCSDRIKVIYNWADEDNPTKNAVKSESHLGRCFKIVYAGNLGFAQGLGVIIEAAKKLESKNVPVEFLLIGSGPAERALQAIAKNTRNVRFVPFMEQAKLVEEIDDADALIVNLKPAKHFDYTIPSKLQSYLFWGKPILAGLTGDGKKLLERSGAGLTYDPSNDQDLVTKVESLVTTEPEKLVRMSLNGKEFYRNFLSREIAVKEHVELLKSIVGEQP